MGDPEEITLRIRALIREPLSRYMAALAELYQDAPEDREYAGIRHGVTTSLLNTLKGMPGMLNPEGHAMKSLGAAEILAATAARFSTPIELVKTFPGISHDVQQPLIEALTQSAGMLEALIPGKAVSHSDESLGR